MPSCDLSIPGYSILRRDSKTNNETGLIIYINDILSYKHLSHLDQPGVEAVWLEIGFSKSTPILVGFCYRNPQGSHLCEKTAFFTHTKKKKKKKSKLRKSENAVRLLYSKPVTSHIKMRLVFSFFCTQQRRFVEHLTWV